MDWFSIHADTFVILGAFATSILWINGKFNDLEKDIVMIKTIMIVRNIMPSELAKSPIDCQEIKK
jgi:ethanolamine utilization cobalamin adenosyltransferase